MVPLMVPQVPDDITPSDRKSWTSGRLAYSRGGTRTRDTGIMRAILVLASTFAAGRRQHAPAPSPLNRHRVRFISCYTNDLPLTPYRESLVAVNSAIWPL